MADLLQVYPPSQTVIRHTTETILKLASLGNVILIGRGGNVITARLPNIFHVRLVAPLEQRIEHSHESYGMTENRGPQFCLREDLGRERYLKNISTPTSTTRLLYHLIINTGLVGYDNAAKLIGDAMLNQPDAADFKLGSAGRLWLNSGVPRRPRPKYPMPGARRKRRGGGLALARGAGAGCRRNLVLAGSTSNQRKVVPLPRR
jgi:cytidylate kinase